MVRQELERPPYAVPDNIAFTLGLTRDSGLYFRTATHNANTALTAPDGTVIFRGTPVSPAIGADTLIIFNAANNGDIVFAINNAGNTEVSLKLTRGSSQTLFADGTVSLPGLAFINDVDTGLYSIAANTLGISTQGTERVRISSSEVVLNDAQGDLDFRAESDNFDNFILLDAATDLLYLGSRPQNTSQGIVTIGTAARNVGTASLGKPSLSISDSGDKTITGNLTAGAQVDLKAPSWIASSAFTIDDGATLRIGNAPTDTSNVTITNKFGLWLDAGIAAKIEGTIFAEASVALDLTTTGNRIDFDTDNDTSIRASADDVLMIELAGTDRLQYGVGAWAFQEATTISTTTGDLTLNPSGVVRLPNSKILAFGTTNGTDWDFYHDGSDQYMQSNTGGLMLAMASSPPGPDNNYIHAWFGSAGSVTAVTVQGIVIEHSGAAALHVLIPTSQQGGIFIGTPDSNTDGFILYGGSTYSPADTMRFGVNATEQIQLSDATFRFSKAFTISTSEGDLTLNPSGLVDLNNNTLDNPGAAINRWTANGLDMQGALTIVDDASTGHNSVQNVLNTQGVSTSATVISPSTGGYAFLMLINGIRTDSSTTRFCDLIMGGRSVTPTTIASHSVQGAPDTRTYTSSVGTVSLQMGGNTYDINITYFNLSNPT